jgi:hypothetical protein
VRRTLYAKLLAEKARLHEDEVRQAIGHARAEDSGRPAAGPPKSAPAGVPDPWELSIAQLIVQFPSAVTGAISEEVFDLFGDSRLRAVARVCFEALSGRPDLDQSTLSSRFEDPADQATFTDLILREPVATAENASTVVRQGVDRLRDNASKRKRKELLAALAQAERDGDTETARRLNRELQSYRPGSRAPHMPTSR